MKVVVTVNLFIEGLLCREYYAACVNIISCRRAKATGFPFTFVILSNFYGGVFLSFHFILFIINLSAGA
eukprot:c45455_g1_i1 orf=1-204(-)